MVRDASSFQRSIHLEKNTAIWTAEQQIVKVIIAIVIFIDIFIMLPINLIKAKNS